MMKPWSAEPVASDELKEGEVVEGRYLVGNLLGKGGMGSVYRAIHILRRAPVALKVIAPSALEIEGGKARFIREAVAASSVESEHVVRVLDVGTFPNGLPYIVMELLEGFDLRMLVKNEGPMGLPMARAIHLGLQIANALQAAHASGVVHRDLKLSNCLAVERYGDRDFVKVLDFGVSKLLATSATLLTSGNLFIGTLEYMAPEQATAPKDADERSDIYSLGVILYKLLSGSFPYSFSKAKTLVDKVSLLLRAEPVPLLSIAPHLPAELCAVVHRAFRRPPAERFTSATAFAEALAPFADSRSVGIVSHIRDWQKSGSVAGAKTNAAVEAMLAAAKVKWLEENGLEPSHSYARMTSQPSLFADLEEQTIAVAPDPSTVVAPFPTTDVAAADKNIAPRGAPNLLSTPEAPRDESAFLTRTAAPATSLVGGRHGGFFWVVARWAVILVLCFGVAHVLVNFFLNR